MNRIGLSCEALQTVCTKCQQYFELENIESFNKERCEACLLQLCYDCDRRGTEADFHFHAGRTYCDVDFPVVRLHDDDCLCKIRLSQKDVVAHLQQQRRQEYKAELALRKAEETKMERSRTRRWLARWYAISFATGLAGRLVFDKITEMRGRKRSLESTTKEETNQEKRVKTS